MKRLCFVEPYLFENNLIIALADEWINVLGKLPKFEVLYENGKLVIQTESKKVKDDYI